jgi:hypothetical protein
MLNLCRQAQREHSLLRMLLNHRDPCTQLNQVLSCLSCLCDQDLQICALETPPVRSSMDAMYEHEVRNDHWCVMRESTAAGSDSTRLMHLLTLRSDSKVLSRLSC